MTTPYEKIVSYIQDDVDRPDLSSQIDRRIQRAIQFYHRKDQWKRDLVEQTYIFDQQNTLATGQVLVPGSDALYLQSVPAANDLWIQEIEVSRLTRPRFFLYFKKWITINSWGLSIIDPTTGTIGTTSGGDIEEASADSMTDAYGFNRTDVYYRSGDKIKINSSTPLNKIYIGYFSDPLVEPVANIHDWMSTDYPELIAAEVSMRIFKRIGKEAEAKGAAEDVAREYMNMAMNNIRVTGK